MIIENSFAVAAPRDAVVAYFLDAEQALGCVPGVEGITKSGDHAYTATLGAKVGPIKANFAGTVTYDPSQAPESIRATGEGRDRASGSLAKVTLDAAFSEPEPGRTLVSTHADLAIRGRLGQFGTGVVQAIADEMIGSFARCLEARITGAAPAGAPATGGGAGGLVAAAARGLVRGGAAKLTGRRQEPETESS
ncbi:MAG: SRPBCC domain-containing protein [Chloroflexota bacterium]|nr:SRPBCC domain-containing protein [Chloroflexota bacterium]